MEKRAVDAVMRGAGALRRVRAFSRVQAEAPRDPTPCLPACVRAYRAKPGGRVPAVGLTSASEPKTDPAPAHAGTYPKRTKCELRRPQLTAE